VLHKRFKLARPETVNAILKKSARRWATKIAVADDRQQLSYNQLDEYSTAMAWHLLALGVRQGDRVAILDDRGIDALIGLLAVLKTAGTYVPFDPRTPTLRLSRLLAEIKPSVVMIASRHAERVKAAVGDWQTVTLGTIDPNPARESLLPTCNASDAAYCMYTSGSTGEPRGVEIEHRSIVEFFKGFNPHFHLTSEARCLNTSPYYFDVSVADVLMPLAYGATVYFLPNVLPPDRVLDAIEKHRITHICPPAPLLTLLCGPGTAFERRALHSLRYIMTGAEVVSREVVRKWLNHVPRLRIVNAYGPTEATCACFCQEITSNNFHDFFDFPIGRPFNGVHPILLNENGIVQGHARGELAVAGVQVMRGYYQHSAETTARILLHEGRRYYRTGDICEVDGVERYYFRGRIDNEVKFKGYRVNLDEISVALQRDIRVLQAVAGVVRLDSDQPVLCAALVLRDRAGLSAVQQILTALRDWLPAYMVPEYATVFDAFPQLASGKTDTKAAFDLVSRAAAGLRTTWARVRAGAIEPLA